MSNKRNVLQQFGDYGCILTGLDATPTGTDPSADVVADFTGATTAFLEGIPSRVASTGLPPAITIVHSQTLGSTFKVPTWGTFQAFAAIQAQTAASILAAINLDGIAADLNADPVQMAAAPLRQLMRALRIATAADSDPMLLTSRPFVVTKRMAHSSVLAIVRLLLSNNAGAGAAAASLLLASCSFGIVRTGEIPAYLASRD